MNQRLLSEVRVALLQHVNNEPVQSKLPFPRAGVELLHQGLHQRKCVKRHQEASSVLPQDGVLRLLQHEHVKPLYTLDHLAQITGSDRALNFMEGSFQVVHGEFVFSDQTCRKALQHSSHLIDVNDICSLEFQHAGASAVPLGYE